MTVAQHLVSVSLVSAALLGAALGLASQDARAQTVQAMPLRISAQQRLGALPAVFRPSVMMSWADDEAIDAFLSLPGRLGTVRLTLESALSDSTSLADYLSRLKDGIPRMKQLAARGATIVLTVARMPRWLSISSSEASTGANGFSVREASPPKDADAFANLAFETVRAINVEQHLDVLYEFWNEPEANIFWVGTQSDLLKAYASFASGARRADPKAKVGGLGGAWNERRAGQPETAPPLMKAFIDNAAAARLPLDFVSWHNFPKQPDDGWDGAEQVRDWLKASALPVQTPQVVSEWNRWATFPDWIDPPRDVAEGAAFMLASLHRMAMQGVSMQTMATLQDFNDPPSGSAYPGDFGLLTRSPMLAKAGFHVMAMLAAFDGQQRAAVQMPAVDVDAQGVDILAASGLGHVSVLLSRYAPVKPAAVAQVFGRSLLRSGITSRSQIAVSDAKLASFASRQSDLGPAEPTPVIRQALVTARAAAEQAGARVADEMLVTLGVDGVPPASRYRVFRIGLGSLDPGRAYRDERTRGGTHTAALAAARAQQAFVPVASGTGPVPALRLPAFAAVLVVVDGGPAN